ncbi:MAG: c-type cytochrome [Cyanobacteria bacterium Co-bin13]|nr:c-type cytochrome [Cyanobacteria bacterium Co-bin13]
MVVFKPRWAAAVRCLVGVVLVLLVLGANPAAAVADPAASPAPAETAPLFELHCAGCHPNGGNIIRRGKTLKQKALKRNGVDSEAAIAALVSQGKGIMPAFAERLSADEIAALSHYVVEQAAAGWQASS